MSASTEVPAEGLLANIKFNPAPPQKAPDAPPVQVVNNTVVPDAAPLSKTAPDPSINPNAPKDAPRTDEVKSAFNPLVDDAPKADPAAPAEEVDAVAEKYKDVVSKMNPSQHKAFEESRKETKQYRDENKALKTELDSLKKNSNPETQKTIDDLKSKVAELSKINPDTQRLEYESVKKERDELNEKLKVADLKSTPEYQQAFEQPIERATKELRDFAQKNKLSVSDFMEALSKTDTLERGEILDPILESLSPFKQQYVMDRLKTLDNLIPNRDKALKNSEIARQVIEDNRRKQNTQSTENFTEQVKLARERSTADYRKAHEIAVSQLQKEIPLFRKHEGQDEHNKWVDSTIELAKGLDIYALTPSDQALALLYASSYPKVLEIAKAQSARVKELEGILSKRSAGQPNMNPPTGGVTSPKSNDDGGGLVDAIAKAMPTRTVR